MRHPPEPFIGNPNAGVYLLQGSPFISVEDLTAAMTGTGTPFPELAFSALALEQAQFKNLRHEFNRAYPMFYLNPEFNSTKGFEWYASAFKGIVSFLKEKHPSDLEDEVYYSSISKNLFIMELYGYHSVVTHHSLVTGKPPLPSSAYTAQLVRKAISDKKLIIIARAVSAWYSLVPGLSTYRKCHILASNRGIKVSKTTVSPSAWHELIKIVEGEII